jgi:hypothetical protein
MSDEISNEFAFLTGRAPREGDTYTDAPETVTGSDGHPIVIAQCWSFEDGRWEGFVTIVRQKRTDQSE